MRAGDLRHRVRIEQQSPDRNDWGEALPDKWEAVCEVWADIRQPSGLAAIKADAQTSVVRTSIRIRARAGILPGMRVVHGARIYFIKAGPLIVDGKREAIDLICEEKT